MKHIIDLANLSKEEFNEIYDLSVDMMENADKYSKSLEGKILASLFFEPSTRTSLSFTTAMYRLGGKVIGFSDPGASSVSKGESLKDTIVIASQYADLIVMRNPYEGSALAASLYSECPVINAGDGGHLHPTQTLTDLITIKRYLGRINTFKIGLCGDLKYGRTVHSLIKSLSKYKGVEFVLISPVELRVPTYITNLMDELNINYEVCENLDEAIPSLDVLYMTRIQRERFDDIYEYNRLKDVYVLTTETLKAAKKELLILHPLPRVDEIAFEVDDDERALYFKQAKCGMYGRMALMYKLLKEHEKTASEKISNNTEKACSNPKCITRVEKYLPKLGQNSCTYCEKALKDEK